MKKTKEDATSAGTPKKKKPENKGRLSSMLESMQKRSSPVNAHKVATKYFDDFKKDRSISSSKETEKETTAVTTGVNTAESSALDTVVSNAVSSAVDKKQKKPYPPKSENVKPVFKILDDSHSNSESKVYFLMREETDRKKSSQLRFGLKKLKEKTGLSDKTIRNAIHSLEDKLSIKIVEPSLGVYGRKIQVFSPDEIKERRKKAGLVIDSTTKKIIESDTAVSSAVDSAVTTAVTNSTKHKNNVISLYEDYTGNKWGVKEEKFYKTISNVKPETLEAALILGTMKEGGKNSRLSDFNELIKDAGDSISKPYLDHLRDIWSEHRGK